MVKYIVDKCLESYDIRTLPNVAVFFIYLLSLIFDAPNTATVFNSSRIESLLIWTCTLFDSLDKKTNKQTNKTKQKTKNKKKQKNKNKTKQKVSCHSKHSFEVVANTFAKVIGNQKSIMEMGNSECQIEPGNPQLTICGRQSFKRGYHIIFQSLLRVITGFILPIGYSVVLPWIQTVLS